MTSEAHGWWAFAFDTPLVKRADRNPQELRNVLDAPKSIDGTEGQWFLVHDLLPVYQADRRSKLPKCC